MATGHRAFAGDTTAGIASAILRVDPQSPSSMRPEIPASFDRLVRECLTKEPDRRWQSAHDVALQLAAIRDASVAPEAHAAARRTADGVACRGWVGCGAALLAAAITMRLTRTDVAPHPASRCTSARRRGQRSPTRARPSTSRCRPTASSWRSSRAHREPTVACGCGRCRQSTPEPISGTDGAAVVFWSPRQSLDRIRYWRHVEAPGIGVWRGGDHLQGPEPQWFLRHVEPTRRDPVLIERGRCPLSRVHWRR